MPRIMITMKLTEDERALLKKRAEKLDLTEADYLRMTMVLESILSGDLLAVKVLGQEARVKLAGVMSSKVKVASVLA